MNLTAGLFKGRKVEVPNGVKPTLSKVRQGVFNMLFQFEFENNTFLDMFAGSGLMGLEAVSRGFKVKELEINKKNVEIIKKNYLNLGLKADILPIDALKFKSEEKFDVIYLDPPWAKDYTEIIQKAIELKSETGIIVVEYDGEREINLEEILKKLNINSESEIKILKEKKYGRCRIALIS